MKSKGILLTLVLVAFTASISIIPMEVYGQIPTIDPGMSDVVAFDISKGQQITPVYPSFVADLQDEGLTVATFDLTDGIPNNVMKIIILSMGVVEAYTTEEGTTLANWVFGGGELMINGEREPMVPFFEELMKPFGVVPQENTVYDETDSDWSPGDDEWEKGWVYYQSDNFISHPILTGITEVQFLGGCSLEASSGVIIRTDSDATPPNKPVAVALEWGSGRVVMFGDDNFASDYQGCYGNVDNSILAMQAIEWINGATPPPPEDHDVAAVDQTVVENEVLPGTVVDIDVTVTNLGSFTETFDLSCYYDSVLIGTVLVVDLAPGETRVVTFSWDTTGVQMNTYLIKAHADSGAVITETDEQNNWCTMELPIFVVPELPFGTLLGLASMLAALVILKRKPSIKI